MPGYKSLPSFMTGQAADQVREAESRHRIGDSLAAVQLLEDALEASVARRPELPGWLCGRLAALYRTLGRYDDEVRLLERYRESQTSEEARTRYDARLSKARTIADRKRRSDSGALLSVRASMERPRARRSSRNALAATPAGISDDTVHALVGALADDSPQRDDHMMGALEVMCAEGRRAKLPAEVLVSSLKEARDNSALASLDPEERSCRYGAALLQLLALYFGEDKR
jgi:hypothetical protein